MRFQIGDFDISLTLMQTRVHQIARMIFQCDSFTNSETANGGAAGSSVAVEPRAYLPIGQTLEAIKYISKMYKDEVKQFKSVSSLTFSMLADIMITIHRILSLQELTNRIR